MQDTPALAKPKIGTMTKATQGERSAPGRQRCARRAGAQRDGERRSATPASVA